MPQTPLDTPLRDGRTLIEASAGSGKTRAITTLVARLLVEQERELDSILVVTFTKAATAELRKRIRKTLKAIQDGLTPGGTDDGQALELLEKWRAAESLGEEWIRNRIDTALLDIDRANVYTIHGFCQRALTEFAFETGFPFGFDVRGDGAAIVEGVVRDLWQRRFRDCPRIVAGHASKKNFMPDPLAGWIDSLRSRPDLDIKGRSRPGYRTRRRGARLPGNAGTHPENLARAWRRVLPHPARERCVEPAILQTAHRRAETCRYRGGFRRRRVTGGYRWLARSDELARR